MAAQTGITMASRIAHSRMDAGQSLMVIPHLIVTSYTKVCASYGDNSVLSAKIET